MSPSEKRALSQDETARKQVKSDQGSNLGVVSSRPNIKQSKHRLITDRVLQKLSEDDLKLLEDVKSSCTDLEKIKTAVQLRMKHRISIRLPEDLNDSSYYIEDGLRKVYPYSYLYQSYAKRRWVGRKLKDVMREEFRDIPDHQLKWRFDNKRILVGGDAVHYEHVIRDNDFICNINHRHELPVLATPIKILHRDESTIVIDKPPSVPIHPCGRFRYNSVVCLIERELGIKAPKVVHRLDRLVSGVLIVALNSARAHQFEKLICDRDVQKEYVCRVDGEFPLGDPDDDYQITVDQPLEIIPGKVGITIVHPDGKASQTKFKRLNYNGKTSAVLCRPLTGRMHQIRVHLQYLGHPISNDGLYNCTSFGPEKGKGAKFGKNIKQLVSDIIAKHRAECWIIKESCDITDSEPFSDANQASQDPHKTTPFLSDEERRETIAALGHYFTGESLKDLEKKWPYNPEKFVEDPSCRDCKEQYHDPPLRSLYLYLHAIRYSGKGWSYESDMPVWALDSWKF